MERERGRGGGGGGGGNWALGVFNIYHTELV